MYPSVNGSTPQRRKNTACVSRACSPKASTISAVSSASSCACEVVRNAASRSGGTSVDMIPSRCTHVPPITAVSK
jgi:hypothetical protein